MEDWPRHLPQVGMLSRIVWGDSRNSGPNLDPSTVYHLLLPKQGPLIFGSLAFFETSALNEKTNSNPETIMMRATENGQPSGDCMG